MIRAVVLAGVAVAVCATLAAAAPPPRSAVTGASATLVRITVPGRETVSLGDLTWPTNLSADVQSFQYPDDGSIVSLGRSRATVSAQTGEAATAQSSAEAVALSLFAGEVAAAQVTSSITAGASRRSAGADISGVSGSRAASAGAGRFRGAGLDRVARGLGRALGARARQR